MRLKRFLAKDMASALEQVKRELGPEAIIVSTEKKRIKEYGSPGFRTLFEVVAAIDGQEAEAARKGADPAGQGLGLAALKAMGSSAAGSQEPDSRKGRKDALTLEIAHLKEALSQISSAMQAMVGQGSSQAPSPLRDVSEFLGRLEIDASTQQLLAARIFSDFGTRPVSELALSNWLRDFVLSSTKVGLQAETCDTPCWWAFIGPTGVGKTTTLAKIAARLKFMHGKTGVLVSVDSYRLAATEQLRKYAELMELPFEAATTTGELLRIFARYGDMDFVLVDTTGRNPFSDRHLRELQRIFDAVPELMAQVMLCSSYDIRQITRAIDFYKRFPVAGYTLTKTDETDRQAAPILALMAQDLPLSYITDGQRVPEDIKPVDAALLARMVLSGLSRQQVEPPMAKAATV